MIDAAALKGSLMVRIEYIDRYRHVTKSKTFFYKPECIVADVLVDIAEKFEVPRAEVHDYGLLKLPREDETHNGTVVMVVMVTDRYLVEGEEDIVIP